MNYDIIVWMMMRMNYSVRTTDGRCLPGSIKLVKMTSQLDAGSGEEKQAEPQTRGP
jgi:hypothetical protein